MLEAGEIEYDPETGLTDGWPAPVGPEWTHPADVVLNVRAALAPVIQFVIANGEVIESIVCIQKHLDPPSSCESVDAWSRTCGWKITADRSQFGDYVRVAADPPPVLLVGQFV